jgi:ribokinase
MPRPIVIIGSINMDLVCRTPRMPRPGQTIIGSGFLTVPGGKGANQAVAVARLGGSAHMVGRVGDDDFGRQLLAGLRRNGVNTRHVAITKGVTSGVAMIIVDEAGENSIVTSAGANGRVTPADVDAAEGLIRRAAAVVLQLEIPYGTVLHAIAMCRRLGVMTILDPAPAPAKGLPRAMYSVNVLSPNEHEAAALVAGSKGAKSSERIARALLARGAGSVVLKLGAKGSLALAKDGKPAKAAPFKVKCVDTTAAGDSFTGALAVALSEGRELAEAARFANAAGALCCMTLGAQPAIPDRRAVDRMLRR